MYMHNHLLTIMKIISFRLALGGGEQTGLAALCVCVFVHACMHVCVCVYAYRLPTWLYLESYHVCRPPASH